MLFSIHCRCIECCVYFSFFHLPVFFCIFKVKHNTCVTADIKQPKYFPGCGKHFPFEFFGTAKIYVENSVSLSLFFLSSRLCGIYQQIFVIFNVLTLSFAHYLVFCSELELFQEYLNFLKIERVSVRISWCIIKKFARWNLVWYWTNNFLWKLFFAARFVEAKHFPLFLHRSHFKAEALCLSAGNWIDFIWKICINWKRSKLIEKRCVIYWHHFSVISPALNTIFMQWFSLYIEMNGNRFWITFNLMSSSRSKLISLPAKCAQHFRPRKFGMMCFARSV